MPDDELFDFSGFPTEGSLARRPEPDPWSVLSRRDQEPGESGPRLTVRTLALLAVLVVVGGGLAGAVAGRAARGAPASMPLPAGSVVRLDQLGTVSDLVQAAAPAVVYMSTRRPALSEVFLAAPPEGTFSGIVVDDRGFILTTKSAVESAAGINVFLADGRSATGKVIHKSPDNDIAIVKLDKTLVALPVASLGHSADLRIGDPVLALGNALSFGSSPTVSQGVVTALRRRAGPLDGLIETDATVNRANVGGPLLNLAGQVVGISVPNPPNVSGGHAIGIDYVRPFVDQVVQGRLPMSSGLKVSEFTPNLAYAVGLSYTRGVLVAEVTNGGAGEKAGIQPGDLITQIGGRPVDSEEAFVRQTVAGPFDEPLKVTVLRGKETLTLELTLATNFALP